MGPFRAMPVFLVLPRRDSDAQFVDEEGTENPMPNEHNKSESLEGARHEALFWDLADKLHDEDPRVIEGTIMGGRCLRVDKEFLALVNHKGSGLVVKLPEDRVTALIEQGKGRPFAPAGRVFREWLSVPTPDRRLWRKLLREGIAYVGA